MACLPCVLPVAWAPWWQAGDQARVARLEGDLGATAEGRKGLQLAAVVQGPYAAALLVWGKEGLLEEACSSLES